MIAQEKIDGQEESTVKEEQEEPTMNNDAFDGVPPSAHIKEILGKTINIIGRYTYEVKYDPNSKYDIANKNGKVTKFVIKTKQSFKALYKTKVDDICNWYVTERQYNQLNKFVKDENPELLDKMFENKVKTPDVIPCRIIGGKSEFYYSWLSPKKYKEDLDAGKIYIKKED